jgi:hypothetical protein
LIWFSCSHFGSELLEPREKKTLSQFKIVPIHQRRKEKNVSPLVSPGQIKMRRLLITCEEHNKCSTPFDTAVCARLMT